MGDIYCLVCTGDEIESYLCSGDCSDCEHYETGKCFKIAVEDEDAVERVKDLLRHLREPITECKQLPKLTSEVFDREDCPEWAKYAAVDSDGDVRYHERYPRLSKYWWVSDGNITGVNYGKFNATDWQNSLIERPVKETKLPDWCKVGEWAYSTVHEEYVKIRDIDEFDVTFDRGAYCTVSHKSFVEEYKQARLRPYNAEELKALMGKVIEKGPSMHIVTGFENVFDNVCMVHVNGCLYSANDLLQKGFTYDTKPCGVLEHKNEKGVWV